MSIWTLAAAGALALTGAAGDQQLIGPGYQPQDRDEAGLWMQMNEAERKLKTSNFLITDAPINGYIRSVFCRIVGAAQCRDVRIYLLRTPAFNASMAPNGMMVINSGLFLRVRNEAQLAAILGHEYSHYSHRHTLRNFRDMKAKSNAMMLMAFVPYAGPFLQLGMAGSIMSYSRDMEREADAGSIPLMTAAGYDPKDAARVWEQIRAEQDATAAARGTESRKDKPAGMFASHPPTAERMAALEQLASQSLYSGNPAQARSSYREALAPYWAEFIDDQIKLNDFGGTDFLLQNFAQGEWTPELLYARGELYRSRGRPDDLRQAIVFYGKAAADPSAPVETKRGLGLALLRSGDTAAGRSALRDYLSRRPDAKDRTMLAMLAGGEE